MSDKEREKNLASMWDNEQKILLFWITSNTSRTFLNKLITFLPLERNTAKEKVAVSDSHRCRRTTNCRITVGIRRWLHVLGS